MVSSFVVQNPPAKPAFVYDAECGFCSRWVALWRELTEERVEFIPSAQSPFREVPAEAYSRSSQFIDTDGKVYSGAEAVFRMFTFAHGKSGWLWAYRHVRGFESISEFFYAQIATHRYAVSRVQRLFISAELPHFSATRALFLRLLGIVYLCAFLSLYPQIRGLFGAQGILPAAELMDAARQQLTGAARWHILPTFAWFSVSDDFLRLQCLAGALLAATLTAGLLPALVLPLLWLLWLSLTVVGGDFMSFQWENLLLESGFLAIFLAPMSLTVRRGERPSALALFLFRWLIFRLMFMSGAVKLLSGDPAWRNFTALFYHFETQPLPTALAWHAYQLPSWLLVLQTGLMYLIELGFAFFAFAHRKLRLAAFLGFVALQLGIAITGNYGYFNLLTIVLSVLLLDDGVLRRAVRHRAVSLLRPRNFLLIARSAFFIPAAIVILLVSSLQLLANLGLKRDWSRPMLALYASAAPFRSINSYGLFAVMTKKRPEITVQGSNDGENWSDYTFKYKPAALDKLPGWIAPHQPRLDWQMWFAALGTYEQNRWFMNFCLRLLQGSPPVIDLLAANPFPERPPRFVRALASDYEFTTPAERKQTGHVWKRKNQRIYLPPVSLNANDVAPKSASKVEP